MPKHIEYEDDDETSKEPIDIDGLNDLDEDEMDKVGNSNPAKMPQPPAIKGQEPKIRMPAIKKPALKEVISEQPAVQEPKTEEAQTQDIGQYIMAKLQELDDRLTHMESLLFRQIRQ